MSQDIPDILQAPRPSRSSARSQRLGIDQSPSRLAGPTGQPVQVGIKFAHDGKSQMAMIICLGNQTVPIPLTPESWDELAAAGDTIADQVRALIAAAPPEPEPVIYNEDEAEAIRGKIEQAANNYGHQVVSADMLTRAFRHSEHTRNWARKHQLDAELDLASGNVTFRPARTVIAGESVATQTAR